MHPFDLSIHYETEVPVDQNPSTIAYQHVPYANIAMEYPSIKKGGVVCYKGCF
jgi:hypothetical protein